MRYFGYFDFELYPDYVTEKEWDEFIEGFERDRKNFIYRKFDFCEANIGALAYHAGINTNSVYSAIEFLIQCSLVQEIQQRFWKIYLRPIRSLNKAMLNNMIMKAYAHEIRG